MSQNTIPDETGEGEIPVEGDPEVAPRKRRRARKVAKKVAKKVVHRGWPKGKKRGPRRKPTSEVTPPEINISPSGAKQVGVEVCLLNNDKRFHAPLGSAWRWLMINDISMLEVVGPDSIVVAHFPASQVISVCANIWTKPLW